ncbi:MAG: DUF5717 family protein [Lachnospiraceae bacterium]
MKDTINRLARGAFEYEPPIIEISELNIEETVGINSIYCGELHIRSVGGQNIKGVVSSSNHAVTMDKSTFVGVDNMVSYRVDTRGVSRGEKIEGRFNVISNGGETGVTFTFKVVDTSVDSSMGAIKNLFHFTNLVQGEPDEAYKIFVTDNFEKIFLRDDYELKNRYELLLYGDKPKYLGVRGDVRHCVEEFLISIHKKNRIQLRVSEEYKEYLNLESSMTDSIMLIKNTWGAVKVKISSDNPCLRPEVSEINEESFAGSKYELRYFVDKSKLHAGRNYARILFETPFQTLKVEFLLTTGKEHAPEVVESRKARLEIQKNLSFLLESYLSFRVKRINLAQWTKQSLGAIEKIRSLDDEDPFYKLVHAQLLIAVRKRHEAEWLLENVRDDVTNNVEEHAQVYAYYLYVSSLFRQDSAYAVEAMRIVKRLYEEGHDDWRILWVIFYLDEEYEKNRSLKLVRIKEQFYKGCASPLMYLEAALILSEQPLLLRVFDEFEIQTVLFASRNGLISERLLSHMTEIADNKKTFSKGYWNLLIRLYEKNRNKNLLSSIYKMMIKNDTLPSNAFYWIKEAVEADLRITNLYENYLTYCDKSSMQPLPKLLLLYFAYNSTLDYNLKSYLYANVYANRLDDPQQYEIYKYQIGRFVLDQVSKGHINMHLAMLYKELLEPSMINEDTSKMLANILFSYRVTCSNPDMTTVYVKHKELEEVQTKQLVNGEAYVNLYTKGAGIVLGDRFGNRYTGEELFRLERVFDGDKYIPLAFKYLKDDLWMSLYFCENGKKYGYSEADMVECYKRVTKDARVSEHYRNEFIEKIIDYYYADYDGDHFDEEYIFPDLDKLNEECRIKVTETHIRNGHYEKAMEIIRNRGAVGVDAKRLLRMCSSLLKNLEDEEDPELLNICEIVFKQHKYDEEVLRYLIRYYDCSTKDMVELWKAAKNFDLDTSDLEERLLYQMMFIRSQNGSFAKIFESYYNHGARQRVVEAYIAYNSYNYFIKDIVVDTDVFRVIEHRIREEMDTIDICKLALLKFYADDIETISLTEEQIRIARMLISEMVDKKRIFNFFKKFAGYVEVPHEVMDKTIVEYRTNPDSEVVIHYVAESTDGQNEYVVESMENVFEGIFSKSFVLFYGDNIQYYITEHRKEVEDLTESGSLSNQNVTDQVARGKYEMINDMLACVELQDVKSLRRMMNGYVMSDMMSREIFKPL